MGMKTREELIESLMREKAELGEKIDKIEAFIKDKDSKLEIGTYHFSLLCKQLEVMSLYHATLDERIALVKGIVKESQ